jgi:aquaporin Z
MPSNKPKDKADDTERGVSRAEAQRRALLAEFVGTFALTFVAAGGAVIAKVSGGQAHSAGQAVAPGLVVAALVYALGNDSGAHFNPCVTFAFALRGVFRWRWVPAYWAAQIVGAIAAALLLSTLFGAAIDAGGTHAEFGELTSLAMEAVLTFLLIVVVLGTASRYSLIGADAALAVGATIACLGLFAGPISGASMNPARSLGPAVVSGAVGDLWVYVAGPFAGALLAVGGTAVLHRRRHPHEMEAAEGDHLEHTQPNAESSAKDGTERDDSGT